MGRLAWAVALALESVAVAGRLVIQLALTCLSQQPRRRHAPRGSDQAARFHGIRLAQRFARIQGQIGKGLILRKKNAA